MTTIQKARPIQQRITPQALNLENIGDTLMYSQETGKQGLVSGTGTITHVYHLPRISFVKVFLDGTQHLIRYDTAVDLTRLPNRPTMKNFEPRRDPQRLVKSRAVTITVNIDVSEIRLDHVGQRVQFTIGGGKSVHGVLEHVADIPAFESMQLSVGGIRYVLPYNKSLTLGRWSA